MGEARGPAALRGCLTVLAAPPWSGPLQLLHWARPWRPLGPGGEGCRAGRAAGWRSPHFLLARRLRRPREQRVDCASFGAGSPPGRCPCRAPWAMFAFRAKPGSSGQPARAQGQPAMGPAAGRSPGAREPGSPSGAEQAQQPLPASASPAAATRQWRPRPPSSLTPATTCPPCCPSTVRPVTEHLGGPTLRAGFGGHRGPGSQCPRRQRNHPHPDTLPPTAPSTKHVASSTVCGCGRQHPALWSPDGIAGRAQTAQGEGQPICHSGPGSCGCTPPSKQSRPRLASTPGTHSGRDTGVLQGLSHNNRATSAPTRGDPEGPGAGRQRGALSSKPETRLSPGLGSRGDPVRPPTPRPLQRPPEASPGSALLPPPPHPHCGRSSRPARRQRSFVATSGAGADGLGGAPGTKSRGRLLEESGKKIEEKLVKEEGICLC